MAQTDLTVHNFFSQGWSWSHCKNYQWDNRVCLKTQDARKWYSLTTKCNRHLHFTMHFRCLYTL